MTITLHLGQPVPWRRAPTGIAQISDLRRKNVEICYLVISNRSTRVRRVLLSASKVASLLATSPLLFPLQNMYRRGVVPKQKTFEITGVLSEEAMYLRRIAHAYFIQTYGKEDSE